MAGVRRAAAAVLVIGLAASPVIGHGARAQDAGTSAARLALAAVPAWTATGSVLNLDLRIEPSTPGLELVVTVRARVGSRSAFERTLNGEALGGVVGSVTTPVDGLQPGPVGTHRVAVNLGEAAPAPGPDPAAGAPVTDAAPASFLLVPSLPVPQEGVYPMVVELRVAGSSTVTDSLVTYLVVLDHGAERTPLDVAWVWPVALDAPRRPDGSIAGGFREAITPAGRLAQLTDALAAVPDVPVTLAPRPATLDAWAELASTAPPDATAATGAAPSSDPPLQAAQRLASLQSQAALSSRQVLAGTYARVDLPALATAGLEEEITAQLAEGADVLRATLGIRPDPRTFLATGSLDGRTLAALRRAGVDRLVVPRGALVPVFEQLTPARPFEVEIGSRTFLAGSADPALAEILSPDAEGGGDLPSDAEIAQRLLAGLTVVALEAPSEQRGILVVPRPTWRPTTGRLVGALRGLADHPALHPVTLDGFFGQVSPSEGETGTRALQPAEPGRLAISAPAVRLARDRIASLAAMLPAAAAEPTLAGRRLLLAEAEPFQRRGADPSASDYLAGVDGIIDAVLGAIRLPDAPAVTLTAQRARVPITLVNDFGAPLKVRVGFASDKLLFPDGETYDVELPPRSTTDRYTVEARTSGTFPMLVEVTSPDGRLVVGSFEMTIRSTAVSGVALTITVGAGVFLMGWWGNHVRNARRARRVEEAEEAAPEGPH